MSKKITLELNGDEFEALFCGAIYGISFRLNELRRKKYFLDEIDMDDFDKDLAKKGIEEEILNLQEKEAALTGLLWDRGLEKMKEESERLGLNK